MSNNKKSSVEWYANEENKLFTSYQKGLMSTAKYILFKYKLREQAEAKHKEEIMEAHYATQYGCFSKEYYNEKFGGNND